MTRVSLVSGGGTGIGLAVATELARGGDQVVITGRRADVLGEAATAIGAAAPGAPEVRAIPADLSDPAGVERLRDEVATAYGRVGVLVNNAGGNTDRHAAGGDGLAETARRWTDNFRANVLTAVLPVEAFADLLAEPDGRVILVSSIAAIRGSGSGSYGSAKAALHPYAYDLATRLGPRGITVNVVAPGFIEDTEFFGDQMTAERRAARIGETRNGRAGTPGDVAATVAWLAAPAARHVTGQIVQVNGGAERGR